MVSVNLNSRSWKHIFWMLAVCLVSFGLPLLFKNIMALPPDIYFLFFILCTAGLFTYYCKSSSLKIKASVRSGWALGLILALFFGLGFVSLSLTGAESLSRSLSKIELIPFVWRGLIYGISGGLLISVLPFIVAWRALAGPNPAGLRRMAVVLGAVFCMALTSTSYSLGVSGFERDGLEREIAKNLMAGLPTLISGNPVAAPITGAFMRASEELQEKNGTLSAKGNDLKIAKNLNGGGGAN